MAGVKEQSGKSYDEYDYLLAMSIADVNNFLVIGEDIYLATSAVSPETIIIRKDAWEKMTRYARDMANTLINNEAEFNIFTRCHDSGYCDPKRNRTKNTVKKYGKPLLKRQQNHHVIAKFFSLKWNKPLPFVRKRIREITEFCEVL